MSTLKKCCIGIIIFVIIGLPSSLPAFENKDIEPLLGCWEGTRLWVHPQSHKSEVRFLQLEIRIGVVIVGYADNEHEYETIESIKDGVLIASATQKGIGIYNPRVRIFLNKDGTLSGDYASRYTVGNFERLKPCK